jgi:hypothetical protein
MQTKLQKATTNTMLAMTLLAFAIPGMANKEDSCGQLAIVLASGPGHTCTLVQQNIVHGTLINGTTLPPVLSNIPASFQMQQTVYGPDIKLSYQCDQTKTITIRSHQKYCALKAGQITATSDSPETQAITTRGSAFLGAHGTISWIVR